MAQYQVAWPPFTRNIQITIIGLAVLFLLTVAVPEIYHISRAFLWVSSAHVFDAGYVWTIFTYAFWHADFSHLLFNSFALWMFAGYLDERWSSSWFWTFSLVCAVGGGVVIALTQLILGAPVPTLGYSAAVMGLIGAYCWYNWDRELYFFFLPMTGKTLLLLFLALDVVFVVFGREPISISGHLGGLATGLLLVTGYWKPSKLRVWWRRRNMRKNFKAAQRDVDRKRNGKWIN